MSENRAGPRTPEPAQHNPQDHQSLDFPVMLGTRARMPQTHSNVQYLLRLLQKNIALRHGRNDVGKRTGLQYLGVTELR